MTPLNKEQIESVEKWLMDTISRTDTARIVSRAFREAFSSPSQPEVSNNKWKFFKCAGENMIGRFDRWEDKNCFFKEGYDERGCYSDITVISLPFEAYVATPEQILSHLSAAAEKKGFKPGVRAILPNSKDGYEKCYHDIRESGLYTIHKNFWYEEYHDFMVLNDVTIYERGVWAEIVQEEKCEEKVPLSHAMTRLDCINLIDFARKSGPGYGITNIYDQFFGDKSKPTEAEKPDIVVDLGLAAKLPPDYVDISTVNIEKETPQDVLQRMSREANNKQPLAEHFKSLQTPPPLPEKWCIFRTPENAEMVNTWMDKNYGLSQNLVYGGYIHSEQVNNYINWDHPQAGYVPISDEQFRFWVLGEKEVSGHIIMAGPGTSVTVNASEEHAQQLRENPARGGLEPEVQDILEKRCVEIAVELYKSLEMLHLAVAIYEMGSKLPLNLKNWNDKAHATLKRYSGKLDTVYKPEQPQRDQWEYDRTILADQKVDVMPHLREKSKYGWEAWHMEVNKSHDRTIHFKRRIV